MSNGINPTCDAPCIWEAASARTNSLTCTPTNEANDCGTAVLLEAEPSSFHDAALATATKKINKILAAIPANEQGLSASFVHSRHGVLLARVKHGAKPTTGKKVTSKDDDATVAKALRLKI